MTSILIVSHRRPDLLDRCLRSVAQHLPDHPIFGWDNSGPSDGIRDVVANYPHAKWEFSATNIGFAAAVNRLVEQCDGDFLLLNPDAELLGPLPKTHAAIRCPGVAAAAPLILGGARPWDVAHRELSLFRAFVSHAGYANRLRRISELYPRQPHQVDGYLTGACLLVRRDAWAELGPFDEEFFLYGEEADWQYRARCAGWDLVLADEPGVTHGGHGTTADDPIAARRAVDLLRANVALRLEKTAGVHRSDAFLAGLSVLDRVQRSKRRARSRSTQPAVIITTNRLVFGGAERQRVTLAAELDRRGYDVTIACVQRLGPLLAEIPPTVRVVRQPWWAPAIDTGSGPAVLITGETNTETGFGTVWRQFRSGRRWLVAGHTPPRSDGPTHSAGLATAMRRADGFIALSQRHWAQLSAHQRLATRHFLAPNGLPPLTPSYRQNDPPRLVMLSRIVAHKNPQLLIEALDGLRELPWRLDIYGDGPDRARFEAETPAQLRDRVRWRGWSPGPEHALAGADLLCVPSRSEAFPMVILEAMARAIPVAASAVCAVPDMLDEGRAGILVDPITAGAWRSALESALARPDRLAGIGAAGHERMAANYTVSAMADAYETAFAGVFER